MRQLWICWVLLLGLLAGLAHGEALRVAALHPLMAEVAREVGGELVEVFDLVGEGGNPHRFEPRPSDLQQIQSAALVLAAGKGLENYLDRLRGAVPGVEIVEVGHTMPSLVVGKSEVYARSSRLDDEHDHRVHGSSRGVDPHWWHGMSSMQRAAQVIAREFTKRDPQHRAKYQAGAAQFSERLNELKRWAGAELAKVPKAQRKLVTAHNAFAYFADEFGFQVIAIGGLNHEQNNVPQELAQTIDIVRESRVRAIFPEFGTSDKTVAAIAHAAGAQVGKPLIADGNGRGGDAGFEGMIRHNVQAIVEALAEPQ